VALRLRACLDRLDLGVMRAMFIGGEDLFFETKLPAQEALLVATQTVMNFWTSGVVEAEEARETHIHNPWDGKLEPDTKFVYVYQGWEACELWNIDGWNEEYAHSMIQFSTHPDGVVCVLEDSSDPRLQPIVEGIRAALS
jgi:hypothetical protein